MDRNEIKRRAEDTLFGAGTGQAFAVLDGARWRGLRGVLEESGAAFECLHSGDLDPEVLAVSPYLVQLREESDFFDTVFERIWGQARGILLHATGTLAELRQHLRGLAYAEMPDGEMTLFRFYDPRALALFMSVATPDQVDAIFGERVTHVIAELADGQGAALYLPGSGDYVSL